MSIIATLALSTALIHPTCSWDNPGANRYTGTIRDAIEHYQDIPKPIRERLQQRVGTHQYDDLVEIRRDSIIGRDEYNPEIRDMHFGQRSMCATVSRTKWKDTVVQDGLVYCEENHCIMVPSICGNVSRIVRKSEAVAGGGTGATSGAASPSMFSMIPLPPIVSSIPELNVPFVAPEPYTQYHFAAPTSTGGGWYAWIPPITPAVPEPDEWMMMVFGVFLVAGYAVYMNRK